MYLMLKHIHMTMAALSFIGFFIRGIWMWRQSPWLHKKLVKILPHIIDTLLLISAFALAGVLRYSPGDHPWLMTKIVLWFTSCLGLSHSGMPIPLCANAAG